jgi:four helix bundle protein
MRDFKSLKVGRRAHELVLEIYRSSQTFPKSEMYGLTSPLRRAAISFASNIAEGCGRKSQREMAHFLQVAMGSANEVEYPLLLAQELGFLEEDQHRALESQLSETRRMLAGLVRTVEAAGGSA